MNAMRIHEDDIEKYITWWYDKQRNPRESDVLTVLHANIEAFNWFETHPYIWRKNDFGLITGADYTQIQSLFSLESEENTTEIFKRFKHIEQGVVETSLLQLSKQGQ